VKRRPDHEKRRKHQNHNRKDHPRADPADTVILPEIRRL
jgi:hypothetical protein